MLDCYVIPSSNRLSLTPETANVPVVDFSRLRQDATQRANAIKEIGNACHQVGFFQVSIAIFYPVIYNGCSTCTGNGISISIAWTSVTSVQHKFMELDSIHFLFYFLLIY